MDVGQPRDYIVGTNLYLNFLKQSGQVENLTEGKNIEGCVMIVSLQIFYLFIRKTNNNFINSNYYFVLIRSICFKIGPCFDMMYI